MAPLVSTIDINRPQDEAFSYVTDPTTFAEWQVGVVGMLCGERKRAQVVATRSTGIEVARLEYSADPADAAFGGYRHRA